MKKLLILLLSCLMVITMFSGCENTGRNPEDEFDPSNISGILTIKVMDKGYGTAFLTQIAAAYRKINPNVEFNIIPEPNIKGVMEAEIGLGAELNDTDLYIGAEVRFPELHEDNSGSEFGTQSIIADLNDLMEMKPYGKDITMREQLDSDLVSMLSFEGNVYALPWAAGACGIVYNTKIFADLNLTVPKTTDDLLDVVQKIKLYNQSASTKITPFIWAGSDACDYWNYVTNVWWAQYEGIEQYKKYWSLNDGNPLQAVKNYLIQEGQLEALKVSQQLVAEGVSDNRSSGMDHTTTQNTFAGGNIAMMPCGDWFENETKGTLGATGVLKLKDFAMMKTPILSAAIAKTPLSDIEYWENNGDLAYTIANTHNICIPAYSPQKSLAKDFLRYFFSDDGARIFTKYTGSFLPLKNFDFLTEEDKAAMSNFARSEYQAVSATRYIYSTDFKSPLRYRGTLKKYPDILGYPELAMSDRTNPKTAEIIWEEYCTYHMNNWETYLKTAGLK